MSSSRKQVRQVPKAVCVAWASLLALLKQVFSTNSGMQTHLHTLKNTLAQSTMMVGLYESHQQSKERHSKCTGLLLDSEPGFGSMGSHISKQRATYMQSRAISAP
jgi:hypothetical protein